MASNTHGSNARTHDPLHTNNDIHNYSSSAGSFNLQPEIDDVIASLASMKENRRARQVSKWENMRRQSFRAAA